MIQRRTAKQRSPAVSPRDMARALAPHVPPAVLTPAAATGRVCPRCASTEVRRANDPEMKAFYGGPSFVLRSPWKCKSCSFMWEQPTSAAGARVMVAACACGVAAGGILLAAAALGLYMLMAYGRFNKAWILLPPGGIACVVASLRGLKKYRHRLRQLAQHP